MTISGRHSAVNSGSWCRWRTMIILLPALSLVVGVSGGPTVTGLTRTIQLAFDCHEGSCEVPEIGTEPVPIFSQLLTRIRILGTGLYGSEDWFRIAFAKNSPADDPKSDGDEVLAGTPCDDYLVTEVFKPVVVVPLEGGPVGGGALAGKPLIGGKLRGGKTRKDPTLLDTQAKWAVPGRRNPRNYASSYLLFDVTLPGSDVPYRLCYRPANSTGSGWVFTDPYPWLQVRTLKVKSRYILPLWLEVCLIVLLFTLSGLFSGLNLGLMSLDQTELRLLEKSGTPNERKCTAKIMPLRRRGNFLLCTLVFGNVLVNSTLTILIENLSSGRVAVVVSTIGITLFGEIIPQAVCARYGLEIGAKTVWITKFFMVITAPLAYPISLILDRLLGEDIGSVYDRQRLIELVKLTENYAELGKEEVDIITGALIMRNKTVSQIMTPMKDVYMLAFDSVLDFALLTEIVNSGYTRIPVYEGPNRSNIVAVLNVKDLAFVDPDDKIPLKTVLTFYNHAITYVFEDTPLGSILEEFKKGSSHMAFVRRVINEGDKDPYYEITGLVTLEDVIEEIIQGEILDETDRLLDNRNKQVRNRKLQDFSLFINKGETENVDSPLTPQMALVTYQFLSANVEPFKDDYISSNVLRKLIRKPDAIFVYNVKDDAAFRNYWNPATDLVRPNELYTKDVAADYFILILEGRVRVYVGAENICFESGPFSYFGVQALNAINADDKAIAQNFDLTQALKGIPAFVPDYTIFPLTSLLYIRVKRIQYLAARRATALEKSSQPPPGSASPPPDPGGPDKMPNGHVSNSFLPPDLSRDPNIVHDHYKDTEGGAKETGSNHDNSLEETINPLIPPPLSPPTNGSALAPPQLSPSMYGNYSGGGSGFASRDSLVMPVAGGGTPFTHPLLSRDMGGGSVQTLPGGGGGSHRGATVLPSGTPPPSNTSFRPRSFSHRAISGGGGTPGGSGRGGSRKTTLSEDDDVITEEGGEDYYLLQPLPPYSKTPSSPQPLEDEGGGGRARSLSTLLFKSMSPTPGAKRRPPFKRRLTRNYDGTLKESTLTKPPISGSNAGDIT